MIIRPPCDCCCPPLLTDDFARGDETIDDNPATDSTGNWRCEGTSAPEAKWKIESGELTINVPGGLSASIVRPFARTVVNQFERAVSGSCLFWLPAAGAKVRIELFGEVDEHHSFAVHAEFKANDDPDIDCGTMRILVNDESGNPSPVGDTIPVPGLSAGGWHAARICYDFDLELCTISCDDQRHHYHPVPGDTDSGDPLLPRIFFELWPDQSVAGKYKFDNVAIQPLRSHTGYGYDASDDHCPCCGGPICDVDVDSFDDSSIDCRWSGVTDSWEETDDGLELTGEGSLTWNGSSSGLDEDCGLRSEATLSAILQVSADAWGTVVTLALGAVSATLTWPSAEDAGDGTLALSTGESVAFSAGIGGSGAAGDAVLSGTSVDSVTITSGGSDYVSPPEVVFTGDGSGAAGTATVVGGAVTGVTITDGGSGYSEPPTVSFVSRGETVTLYLCYDHGFIVAFANATVVEHQPDEDDYTAIGKPAIGGNSGDGTLIFGFFEVNHCPICWQGDLFEPEPIEICDATSLCTEGNPPPFVTASLAGLAGDGGFGAGCDFSTGNGSWVLEYVGTDDNGHCNYEVADFPFVGESSVPTGNEYDFPIGDPPLLFPWEHQVCDHAGGLGSPIRASISIPRLAITGSSIVGELWFTTTYAASGSDPARILGAVIPFGGPCGDGPVYVIPLDDGEAIAVVSFQA